MFEYHRRCAANTSDDPTSLSSLWIDLGNTASLEAEEASSLYSAWDKEDAPVSLLRELAVEFGLESELLPAGASASAVPPDAMIDVGSEQWRQWPRTVVRSDASLSVALSFEPALPCEPHKGVAQIRASAALPGKRKRSFEDGAFDEAIDFQLQPSDAVDTAPPPSAISSSVCVIGFSLSRASVYLAGRYVKLARGLSQSSWFLKGKR